jgi:hypothetical protein
MRRPEEETVKEQKVTGEAEAVAMAAATWQGPEAGSDEGEAIGPTEAAGELFP